MWDAGVLEFEHSLDADSPRDVHYGTYHCDIPLGIAAVVVSEEAFTDMFADNAGIIQVRVAGVLVMGNVVAMSRIGTTTSIPIMLKALDP